MQSNPHPNYIQSLDCSLADFYRFIHRLGNIRFVRFIEKEDNADNIRWTFTYRKRSFVLQYSIYNGVSLFPAQLEDEKWMSKLADMLHLKSS